MSNRTNSLPGPDNITRAELENRITVLVYENYAAQSVVMTGTFVAGSIFEDPAKSGLAAMTAAGLMRGTHTRDFDTIHAGLENIGANLSVSGGVNRASFYGKSLAEDLSTLVDSLSDVLRNPTFPVEQVERLRGEILTSLQIRQQDTRYRSSRAFRENLYPNTHPYHHSSQGTLESIPEVQIADMEAFHRRHYGPADMIVVIVGAVNAQEAVNIVRERLGDWRNADQSSSLPIPDLPPVEETRRVSIGIPGKAQSDIVLGVLGPSRNADDFRAASLANSVLG
jgi:zinc protease